MSDVSGRELAHDQSVGLQLHLEKVLGSSPERVFAAFTDADELRQWWGPEAFTVPHLQFDVVEGASYRITMQPPDTDAFHLGGTFRVVEPPGRLVFTFAWEEPDPDDQETLVVLCFQSADEGTNLVLDQQPFKTEQRWQLHHDGWTDTVERLARFLD
ncbi:MAG TPA: SRPBCC domain-containing protein [Galbitalea sp.]